MLNFVLMRSAFCVCGGVGCTSRIHHRKGLGRRRGGTNHNTPYLPPPPHAALSLIFPWDYCNTQEKLKAMVMKNGVNKVRVLWAVLKW